MRASDGGTARRMETKKKDCRSNPSIELSYPDSNQDRQNQKLQCYHYTIRQS